MLLALTYNVFLGVAWTLVGVALSAVAGRKQSIFGFYAAGYGLAAVCAWVLFPNWPVLLAGNVQRPLATIGWSMFCGGITAVGAALLVATLRRGHKGVTWVFSQSAMVVPFIAGVLIWGERPSWSGWLGIAALVGALFLLGRRSGTGPAEHQPGWLPLILVTFAVLGVAQTAFGVMSHWQGWEDAAHLRSPVALTTSFLVHLVTSTVRRELPDRKMLLPLLLWATGALGAYAIAFRTLDLMASYDLAGLVYPIGVGTSIALFSVYSVTALRETLSRRRLAGVLLTLGGVVLLTLARR